MTEKAAPALQQATLAMEIRRRMGVPETGCEVLGVAVVVLQTPGHGRVAK